MAVGNIRAIASVCALRCRLVFAAMRLIPVILRTLLPMTPTIATIPNRTVLAVSGSDATDNDVSSADGSNHSYNYVFTQLGHLKFNLSYRRP